MSREITLVLVGKILPLAGGSGLYKTRQKGTELIDRYEETEIDINRLI